MPCVRLNPTLVAALLAGALLGAPTAQLANAAPPDPEVTIRVVRTGQGTELQAQPRGVGICQNPQVDCAGEVVWATAPGNGAPEPDEYLRIVHKHPGEPPAKCFAKTSFELTTASRTVSSGPVQAGCVTPTAWFYNVELWRDGGEPGTRDDVLVAGPLDPGVIIDRGSP